MHYDLLCIRLTFSFPERLLVHKFRQPCSLFPPACFRDTFRFWDVSPPSCGSTENQEPFGGFLCTAKGQAVITPL